MKVVFLSNYYNHHQSALSEALNSMENVEYYFIATEPMEEERKQLGWSDTNAPAFVKYTYKNEKECIDLVNTADVAILGAAPIRYVILRIKQKKLTFHYSERFFKQGLSWRNYLLHLYNAWLYHGKYQKYPLYMLCASAYTPCDCAEFGNYKNKMFKWGYFPKVYQYDIDKLIQKKHEKQVPLILWVGRFIDWKHPEIPIMLAKRLKEEKECFKLVMIGTGIMKEMCQDMIQQEHLEDVVQLMKSMSPDEVRVYMEKADILLATSDYNEGWGVVINEAMNSGCAVVASHAMGSVPYLIHHLQNGVIYQNSDSEAITSHIKDLLKSPEKRSKLGKASYNTMVTLWSPEIAAERLVELSGTLLEGSDMRAWRITEGPCSRAEVIKQNDMFEHLIYHNT